MNLVCERCESIEFEEIDGVYFCTRCQQKSQTAVQTELDEDVLYTQGARTQEITILKGRKRKRHFSAGVLWTSHEAFNRILRAQVRALEHNCPVDSSHLKASVLSVWMLYLNKCEVAFTDGSTEEPKLSARSLHRDIQIYAYKEKCVPKYRLAGKQSKTRSSCLGSSVFTEISNADEQLVNRIADLPLASEKSIKEYNQMISKFTGLKPKNICTTLTLHQLMKSKSQQTLSDVSSNCSLSENTLERLKTEIEEPTTGDAENQEQIVDDDTNLGDVLVNISEFYSKASRDLVDRIGQQNLKRETTYPESCAFVDYMTMTKTLAILYISCRIANVHIYPCDLVRWTVQGHLPFFGAANVLPEDWKLMFNDANVYNQYCVPRTRTIVVHARKMSNLIGITVPKPDLMVLVRRYLIDMNLPLSLLPIIKRDSKKVRNKLLRNASDSYQRYEVWAMALILVTLVNTFGLAESTEQSISTLKEDDDTFVWSKWEKWSRVRVHHIAANCYPLNGGHLIKCRDVDSVTAYHDNISLKWRSRTIHAMDHMTSLDRRDNEDIQEMLDFLLNLNIDYKNHQDRNTCEMSVNCLTEATDYVIKINQQSTDLVNYLSTDFTDKQINFAPNIRKQCIPWREVDVNHAWHIESTSPSINLILQLISWTMFTDEPHLRKIIDRIERVYGSRIDRRKRKRRTRLYRPSYAESDISENDREEDPNWSNSDHC
ncbi:TATA box-binding protein-associated factor RNA polymerase I subunit B [Halotydeus destructor]|nr:TATA box-binding protein-associated factor RNA polymerase I subunit B [Halotydeus destructor]